MKKHRKCRISLALLLKNSFLLLFISFNLHLSAANKFTNGILDLRGIPASEYKNIDLQGAWEFYWKQLLDPSDFKDSAYVSPVCFEVPGNWNDKYAGNVKLSPLGYATYRARILIDSTETLLAIKLLTLGTACKVFIDGKLMLTAGKVGTSLETSTPGYKPDVLTFLPSGSAIELIVQVSNFHYARGGFWYNYTQFGTNKYIRKIDNKRRHSNFFIVGAMVLFALYLLSLFIHNRRFKYPVYFSLLCILFALRTLCINDILILDIFPNFRWIWNIRLEYLAMNMGSAVFIMFISYFYPHDYNKKALVTLVVVGIITSLVILVTPPIFFTRFVSLLQVYVLLSIGFTLHAIYKAIKAGRDNTIIFLVGFSFMIATVIMDILYVFEIIKIGFYSQWGIVILMFTLAQMMAGRYSKLFHEAENLAENLELLNTNLEEKVEERTSEIEKQNILLSQKNKEIKEINKTKDKFFAIIAHDLRNPVNGIYQLSSLAKSQSFSFDTDHVKSCFNEFYIASKRISELLESLLSWAKVQNGKIQPKLKQLNVNLIIAETIGLLQNSANQKGIAIIFCDQCENLIFADIDMTTTVIRNLLNNAIKFTNRNGQITITVKECDNYIKIAIEDSGIGISENDLKQLFELKTEATTFGTSNEKGSGLGLLLCKDFIELNGGNIWAESEPGKGSVFYFTLPSTKQAENTTL